MRFRKVGADSDAENIGNEVPAEDSVELIAGNAVGPWGLAFACPLVVLPLKAPLRSPSRSPS